MAGGVLNFFGGVLEISNSSLSGNAAPYGGGIWNSSTSSLTGVTLIGNRAEGVPEASGGGIVNRSGTTVVTDSILRENVAVYGGALHNDRGGTLQIVDSTMRENLASAYGGGIRNSDGSVEITRSTLQQNQADAGGGGVHQLSGQLTVVNSTFSGNTADSGGGIRSAAGQTQLTHVTFSGNAADSGGGLWNAGDLSLAATLIDAADSTSLIHEAGTCVSAGYNLFSDDPRSLNPKITWHATDQFLTESKIQALADNGGRTWTHAVSLDSPARDVVVPVLVSTDQRGVPRPQGPLPGDLRSDIGAFELGPEHGSVIVTMLDDVADPFDYEISLREAITYANSSSLTTDTIGFAPTVIGTLLLGSPLPELSTNLVIQGPGEQQLTVERRIGQPKLSHFHRHGRRQSQYRRTDDCRWNGRSRRRHRQSGRKPNRTGQRTAREYRAKRRRSLQYGQSVCQPQFAGGEPGRTRRGLGKRSRGSCPQLMHHP